MYKERRVAYVSFLKFYYLKGDVKSIIIFGVKCYVR